MKKRIWITWLCFAMLFLLFAADTWAQTEENPCTDNCPEGDYSQVDWDVQRDKSLTEENRIKQFPEFWQFFEDADYGVVIEYPIDWIINTNIDQTDNRQFPLRQRSLSDTFMFVNLAIFDNREFQTAEEWLKDDEDGLYAIMDPARITPISVNGHKGLYYISDDAMMNYIDVFIRNEKYMVRLTYANITNQKADMDTFWKMLESLRFRDDPVSFVGKTDIPQEIIDESYTYPPVSLRKLSSEVQPYGTATCCGMTTPGGNYFDCCATDPNAGNCTWYVYHYFKVNKGKVICFTGNANTWWNQASGCGFRQSSIPVVGAIAWSATAGPTGHVGIVTAIREGGITMLQQWYCNTSCPGYSWPSTSSYQYMIP